MLVSTDHHRSNEPELTRNRVGRFAAEAGGDIAIDVDQNLAHSLEVAALPAASYASSALGPRVQEFPLVFEQCLGAFQRLIIAAGGHLVGYRPD